MAYDPTTSGDFAMVDAFLADIIGHLESKFYLSNVANARPDAAAFEKFIGPAKAAAKTLLSEYVSALKRLVDERETASTSAA